MNFKEYVKYYINGKRGKFDIRDIINKMPENDIIASDILRKLNNNTTKIVKDDDIKGNYYVFLKDTIYFANNSKSIKDYSRLTLIAHECVHSIQSKILQIFNFTFSNLEIFFFLVIMILKLFFKIDNIDYIYVTILLLSIFFRYTLEIHASLKSIKLTKDYLFLKNIDSKEIELTYRVIKFQVISLLPIMLFSLIFLQIIRLIIILFI